jgi:hypothetical protein
MYRKALYLERENLKSVKDVLKNIRDTRGMVVFDQLELDNHEKAQQEIQGLLAMDGLESSNSARENDLYFGYLKNFNKLSNVCELEELIYSGDPVDEEFEEICLFYYDLYAEEEIEYIRLRPHRIHFLLENVRLETHTYLYILRTHKPDLAKFSFFILHHADESDRWEVINTIYQVYKTVPEEFYKAVVDVCSGEKEEIFPLVSEHDKNFLKYLETNQ